MIRVFQPGSGSLLFTHPGSRGQEGTGSRIPDPDPQHWVEPIFFLHFHENAKLPICIRVQKADPDAHCTSKSKGGSGSVSKSKFGS
jgi:hypothetical protein